MNLYGFLGNNALNGVDAFGLVDYEFIIIKNQTGHNGKNQSDDYGSPEGYFTGTESHPNSKSASTTWVGHWPITGKGHCCNTVNSKDYPANHDAGSIVVFMKNADPGTYAIDITFSGNANIRNASKGDSAGAVLEFFNKEKLVMIGDVGVGRKGTPTPDWSGSATGSLTGYGKPGIMGPIYVEVKNKSDRVLVGSYDLTMNMNACGNVIVTATGNVSIDGETKVK